MAVDSWMERLRTGEAEPPTSTKFNPDVAGLMGVKRIDG
jgi:hypothetical protein